MLPGFPQGSRFLKEAKPRQQASGPLGFRLRVPWPGLPVLPSPSLCEEGLVAGWGLACCPFR